jgi:hypothetical protein
VSAFADTTGAAMTTVLEGLNHSSSQWCSFPSSARTFTPFCAETLLSEQAWWHHFRCDLASTWPSGGGKATCMPVEHHTKYLKPQVDSRRSGHGAVGCRVLHDRLTCP